MTSSPPDLDRFLAAEHHAIHLLGVAGSGMSGIAALLLELGHKVSGSDKVRTLGSYPQEAVHPASPRGESPAMARLGAEA